MPINGTQVEIEESGPETLPPEELDAVRLGWDESIADLALYLETGVSVRRHMSPRSAFGAETQDTTGVAASSREHQVNDPSGGHTRTRVIGRRTWARWPAELAPERFPTARHGSSTAVVCWYRTLDASGPVSCVPLSTTPASQRCLRRTGQGA